MYFDVGLPVRVVGEGEAVNASRVALQVEGSRHLFELAALPEAHLPHLHIGGESTGRHKSEEAQSDKVNDWSLVQSLASRYYSYVLCFLCSN